MEEMDGTDSIKDEFTLKKINSMPVKENLDL